MLLTIKSIHGLIEIDVSGNGYTVPSIRHRGNVLFRYLWQSVLALLPRSIKLLTNRDCDIEDIDCLNQNINAFRKNVMKILE